MEYIVSTTTYSIGAAVFINRHTQDTDLEKICSFAVVEKNDENGNNWIEIYLDGELVKKMDEK